jgi:hypothetical protein
MYENIEVSTLEAIKAEFNKHGFEFTYCLATLWKIFKKISFTYRKTINRRLTIVESEQL